MKTYIFILLLCPALILLAFSGSKNETTPERTAQEVRTILKEAKSLEFYVEQAELWWEILEKDKKDEDAWFNYFKANRFAKLRYNGVHSPEMPWSENTEYINESNFLMPSGDIVNLIEKHIPNTFVAYYTKGWDTMNPKDALPYYEKALAVNPEFYDLYNKFILNHEVDGYRTKRKEMNEKWFKSNNFSVGNLNHYYNVLATIKKNGVILTWGDNPLMSYFMLQDALGFREDVTPLNIPLIIYQKAYRNRIFKQLNIPILDKEYKGGASDDNANDIVAYIIKNKPKDLPLYFDLTLKKTIKNPYEDNLFLVGLALEYSENNIDNLAQLKRNFESKYLFDYLNVQFSYDDYKSNLSTAYIHGITMLYDHYKASNELQKADKMRKLAFLVSKDFKNEDYKKYITYYFSN